MARRRVPEIPVKFRGGAARPDVSAPTGLVRGKPPINHNDRDVGSPDRYKDRGLGGISVPTRMSAPRDRSIESPSTPVRRSVPPLTSSFSKERSLGRRGEIEAVNAGVMRAKPPIAPSPVGGAGVTRPTGRVPVAPPAVTSLGQIEGFRLGRPLRVSDL